MPTYYRPMKTAEDWQALVADPDKHWREGYSARTLAYCWHEAMGVPAEIDRALRAFEPFRGIELLLGLPEHQVPLPGGVRPSQSDIWCLARQGDSLVSMTIEGKVDETLRPTVGEWLAEGSPGKDTPGCPPPRGHPRPCRLDLTGGFRATNSRQWVSLMGRYGASVLVESCRSFRSWLVGQVAKSSSGSLLITPVTRRLGPRRQSVGAVARSVFRRLFESDIIFRLP